VRLRGSGPGIGPILERLDAKDGLFAVLGDHDHFRVARIVLDGLRRASIRVLMNEGVRLTVGDGSIFLAGIDSVSPSQRDPRAAFSAGKDEAVSLVLVHEPDYIDQLSRLVPVDLQLSGHTHRPGSYSWPRRSDSSGEGPNVRRRFVPCRSEPGLHQPRDRDGRRSFPIQMPTRSNRDYSLPAIAFC
jgi:hypothetical protein